MSLAQLIMARWPITEAREEKAEEEEERTTLTRCPGACLDGMAGLCPRGWPGATWGSLHRAHREHRTSALPPACTHTTTPQATTASTRKRSGGVSSSEATGANETRARSSQRSHRRGEGFRIHLEEEEEGSEANIWPKWRRRRSPEPARITGRWCRRLGCDRVGSGEREGAALTVWVGLTDPAGQLGFWPAQVD
jgi:hypothetical protein